MRTSARHAILAATLLAALDAHTRPVANAQPIPLAAEIDINEITGPDQTNASLDGDGLGNFVVVWQSAGGQDGQDDGVFGRRLDSTGTPVGNDFQVNTYTSAGQAYPAVAGDGGGGFVVVWEGEDQDGVSHWDGIFGQRFDSSGAPVGTEFQVNSYTTDSQIRPGLGAAADGTFVVAWSSSLGQDGDDWGVFAQRFDASANPVGTEFQVNTYTTESQVGPALAVDSAGTSTIVWISDRHQDGDRAGIFARRYDSNGAPAGGEFQVNTYTTDDQTNPRVSSSPIDGSLTVVWQSYEQDGDDQTVVGRRFDSTGAALGAEFIVNTYTSGVQFLPRVAHASDGSFVVAWSSEAQDGEELGIYAQRYNAAGNAVGAEFGVNSFADNDQLRGELALATDETLLVVWQSTGQRKADAGIFGQRFDLATTPPCGPAPALGCESAATGKSTFQIRKGGGSKDRLNWKLKGGSSTVVGDFLDPLNATPTTQVCLYDAAAVPQPLSSMFIAHGGDCAVKPKQACWRTLGSHGFKYTNRHGGIQGVNSAKLKAKPNGQAQIQVKARGAKLPLPPLPVVLPATMQLIVDDGVSTSCWEAVFTQATSNDGDRFKATTP